MSNEKIGKWLLCKERKKELLASFLSIKINFVVVWEFSQLASLICLLQLVGISCQWENNKTLFESLPHQVGLAINPPTPVEVVLPYVELVDAILIMTVNPGFGGQKFISDCMSKVRVSVPKESQWCALYVKPCLLTVDVASSDPFQRMINLLKGFVGVFCLAYPHYSEKSWIFVA